MPVGFPQLVDVPSHAQNHIIIKKLLYKIFKIIDFSVKIKKINYDSRKY